MDEQLRLCLDPEKPFLNQNQIVQALVLINHPYLDLRQSKKLSKICNICLSETPTLLSLFYSPSFITSLSSKPLPFATSASLLNEILTTDIFPCKSPKRDLCP